jgi:hypothetical protein
MATKSISNTDRQWEVEDALRTLQRAEKIRKDSALMGEVKKSVASLQKMAFGGSTPKPTKKK